MDIVPEGQGQLKGTVTSVTFKGMQYDIIVDFYEMCIRDRNKALHCWGQSGS